MATFEEIKARANKATPGPWLFGKNYAGSVDEGGEYNELEPNVIVALGQGSDTFWLENHADCAFIAKSRQDVPLLLKALELVSKYWHKGHVNKTGGIDLCTGECNISTCNYWLELASIELEASK